VGRCGGIGGALLDHVGEVVLVDDRPIEVGLGLLRFMRG